MATDEVARDAPTTVKLGERQSIEELTGGRIRKLPRTRGERIGAAAATLARGGEDRPAAAGAPEAPGREVPAFPERDSDAGREDERLGGAPSGSLGAAHQP